MDTLKNFKKDLDNAYNQSKTDNLLTIIKNIRKIVSARQKDAPTEEFLESGLAEYFISFISEQFNWSRDIQKEAMWY